jgi:hypothetical protein
MPTISNFKLNVHVIWQLNCLIVLWIFLGMIIVEHRSIGVHSLCQICPETGIVRVWYWNYAVLTLSRNCSEHSPSPVFKKLRFAVFKIKYYISKTQRQKLLSVKNS